MNASDHRDNRGTTLVELLVAIAIAGIVTTLCFMAYSNTVRVFSRQSRTAADLRSTIVVKKKIDRLCGAFSTLTRWTDHEVSGVCGIGDNSHTVRFYNGALFDNSDTVAFGIERFAFSLVENTNDRRDRTAVLQWEGVIAASGHWIGGAVTMVKK